MINEPEKRFREAERRLDGLVQVDEATIAAHGIAVTDESVRVYHYKSQYLSWRYRFEIRRARGGDVEKVSVELSLDEANVSALRVRMRAEIFQIGQFSRWQSTTDDLVSLEHAARDGLSSIIFEAIRAGEAAAADAE